MKKTFSIVSVCFLLVSLILPLCSFAVEQGTTSSVTKLNGTETTGTEVQKTEWPDAELVSVDTGAPLIGTEVKLNWNKGFIGSQYYDTKAFKLGSNSSYYYSDQFTVPKAGTDVVFFDQTFCDWNKGYYASAQIMTVSHWKDNKIDKTKTYLTGSDVYSKIVDQYYRVYRYTTTEDNETIVLCLRLAAKYEGENPLIQPVYLVEKQNFDINSGKFYDPSGNVLNFTAYLPAAYNSSDDEYPIIFDTSADGSIAAAAKGKNYVAIACPGDGDDVFRLLDTVLRYAKVRISDLTIVGGEKFAAHLEKHQTLRFCSKFIYKASSGFSSITGVKCTNYPNLASPKAAMSWIEENEVCYYDILHGLTMYAIGDSYFAGSHMGTCHTWVNIMGTKYSMNFHNYGINSNTVAFYEPLTANQPPMCSRIDELPSDGNIYLVEGGRNDHVHFVPFGENNSTDRNTFKGALNIIINTIKKKQPDAFIILVTPWSYENEVLEGALGTNNDYADAMKELVAFRNDSSIVCMYAADKSFSKIDAGDKSCRNKYFRSSSDVSHLNYDGFALVEPIFEKWIAEAYDSYLKGKNIPVETTKALETTKTPETTKAPLETTKTPVETTKAPETTKTPETTKAPLETTKTPIETTKAPVDESSAETTTSVATDNSSAEITTSAAPEEISTEVTTSAPDDESGEEVTTSAETKEISQTEPVNGQGCGGFVNFTARLCLAAAVYFGKKKD